MVTSIATPSLGQTYTVGDANTWPGQATDTSAEVQANTFAPAPGVHYYLADQVGTTQMELSTYGWPDWQGLFAPFGQEYDSGGTPMHYKFTGKERDTESGLDYFAARYYSSSMGRFSSPDPSGLALADPTNPQSLNLYSYAFNSPLKNTDPTGLYCYYDADEGRRSEQPIAIRLPQ